MNADFSTQGDKSRILITGAGGLLGSSICQTLYKQHFPILPLYKSTPACKLLWDYACADIEKNGLEDALAAYNISAIIHCAALIPGNDHSFAVCGEVNAAIDKNISRYVIKNKIEKLVFISTTNMYGVSDKVIDENTELKIDNLYSRAKANSENLFIGIKNTETTALRINAPYHHSQKSNTVLKIFINKIMNGEDIFYHGTGARQQDFTHVTDIAAAVTCSLKTGTEGIYNIAAGKAISMKNLAGLILSKVPGSKSKIFPSGKPDEQENHKALFDITRAKLQLGWQPSIPLSDGIDEWIKYLKR